MNYPAALLQPPFFDPTATAAVTTPASARSSVTRSATASTTRARSSTPAARLNDWWTAEDRAHFEKSGAALVAQYDATAVPRPRAERQADPQREPSDLAGLAAAHDAWQASLGGKPVPVVSGLDGERAVLRRLRPGVRGKAREAALPTDHHRRTLAGNLPPLTVRNLDPWYAAFDVRPGRSCSLAEGSRQWSGDRLGESAV